MIDRYPAEMRPFIEMILAHPNDDAPVLIFADWLEENGWENRAYYHRRNPDIVRRAYFSLFRKDIRKNLPPQIPAAGV
jgi:uncharacterized protein (TIGR02996 family)